MWGGVRARRGLAGLSAVVLTLLLVGCQVVTSVGVRVQPDGSGTVTVQVIFDRAAAEAVGGVDQQLRVADLTAAGWTTRLSSGPDASTVVTLSHGFASTVQVPGILGEVGRSPTGRRSPLFALRLSRTATGRTTTTTATGEVDLSCGLSCFGDAGLRRAYGSELGVDPHRLAGRGGTAAADRDLRFAFTLEVPGRVTSSDASSQGLVLRWTPTLGRRIPLSASATATAAAVGATHLSAVAVGGGVIVIVLLGAGILVVVLARRRRHGRAHRERPDGRDDPAAGRA